MSCGVEAMQVYDISRRDSDLRALSYLGYGLPMGPSGRHLRTWPQVGLRITSKSDRYAF